MITLRNLQARELGRLGEIDRTETITRGYRVLNGVLVTESVDWQAQAWSRAQVEEYVRKLTPEVEAGGLCVAAEEVTDAARVAGVAVLGARPVESYPSLLQLVFFHVSREHRRGGIGGLMFERVEMEAQRRGAAGLYISAAPTESAIGFYLGRGAELITPDPRLLAFEPEDIHLAVMFSR